MLDPFLYRLLIGVLVLIIGQALIGILPTPATAPRAKQLLSVVLIILIVIYIIFGAFITIR